MVRHIITVKSKNKISIKKFMNFVNSISKNRNLKIAFSKKCSTKKSTFFRFSILKSPHVNKTAQEQFEFKLASKRILFEPTTKNLKFLLTLKKIKSNLFPDIKICVKSINNLKLKKDLYKKVFSQKTLKKNLSKHPFRLLKTKVPKLRNSLYKKGLNILLMFIKNRKSSILAKYIAIGLKKLENSKFKFFILFIKKWLSLLIKMPSSIICAISVRISEPTTRVERYLNIRSNLFFTFFLDSTSFMSYSKRTADNQNGTFIEVVTYKAPSLSFREGKIRCKAFDAYGEFTE